jgi:hypothetical protein
MPIDAAGQLRRRDVMSRPDPMPVADLAPSETSVTVYDRAYAATYLRLLDAAAEGAPWQEACQIVLAGC